MKEKLSILLGALLCLFLVFFTSCRSNGYRMVWKENFSGRTLDESVWSKIPRGPSDWNRHMTSFDSCYALRRGKLILRGIRNYSLPNDTAPYITGGVYTKDKKGFGIGRIEIKARLGMSRGAWPAFWMLPQKAQWPKGGEIDIMEHLNYDEIAYQTVHSHYTVDLGKSENPKHGSTGRIRVGKYNVYAVEIHPDSLSFYINGHHTFSYPRIPEAEKDGQYEFTRQPFFLLLDMQLGGNWVGRVDQSELPVEMSIDWVKYFEPTNGLKQ